MKANKPSAPLDALKDLKRIRKQLAAASPKATPEPSPTVAPKKNEFKRLLNLSAPSTSTSGLHPHDQALFLQAVRDVKPLRSTSKRVRATQTLSASQHEALRLRRQHALGYDELSTLHSTSDLFMPEDIARLRDYLNPICGPDVLKKLKKGQWRIANSIDLHGATLDQARLRLDYFLKHSLAEGFKCIRIVHGIGYGSKANGPVLPTTVRRWLTQLDFVLAFSDCAPNEGGGGAVKVLLRTSVVID